MLKQFALVLVVLCTAHAYSFNLRDGQVEGVKEKRGEPESHGSLTHQDIREGMEAAVTTIYPYKGKVDQVIVEILTAGNKETKEEWFGLIDRLTGVMNHGAAIYDGTLEALEKNMNTMFRGENDFRKEAQCHSLFLVVSQEGFGKEEWHLGQMLLALSKDLVCMDVLMGEVYNLGAQLDEDCEISEMDVLRGTVKALVDLFKLKNNGMLLHYAMHLATTAYNDEPVVQGINEHYHSKFDAKKSLGSDDLLEKLLAALQKKRD